MTHCPDLIYIPIKFHNDNPKRLRSNGASIIFGKNGKQYSKGHNLATKKRTIILARDKLSLPNSHSYKML